MNKKLVLNIVSIGLVSIYIIWWILLWFIAPEHDSSFNGYFADTYGILAGVGGIAGIIISRKWGTLKSDVGRSIFYLSAGLLSQFLGQLSYTYLYYVTQIENPYPAFGEIFFMASIPLYILGISYIAKASGFNISFKSFIKKPVALMIPILMMTGSYYFLLRGYDGSGVSPVIVFLDFFYPLGQALFVSLAMVTFFTTNKMLGGLMRGKVLFILFALVFQYFADSLFIYETKIETWFPGGVSDLLFVLSYFLMSVGLYKFYSISEEVDRLSGEKSAE